MKNRPLAMLLTTTGALIYASAAQAHISISQVGVSNATNEIAFNVGHGCDGDDSIKIVVDVPEGVTSLRTMTSDFGPASVTTDRAGVVTNVTWQKPVANLLPADTGFYRLVVRARLPDKPFTEIYFKIHQTCRDHATGTEVVVDWDVLPPIPPTPDGGTEPHPAAVLKMLPARVPGWNKYTLPEGASVKSADLPGYFAGALIVWKGTQAYSPNANTRMLITTTSGVTPLTELAAGDEIWVKY